MMITKRSTTSEKKTYRSGDCWICWCVETMLYTKLADTVCIHNDAPIQPLVVITKYSFRFDHSYHATTTNIYKSHVEKSSNNHTDTKHTSFHFHFHWWFVFQFPFVFRGCQASYDSNTQCPSWSPQSPPEKIRNGNGRNETSSPRGLRIISKSMSTSPTITPEI